MSSEPLTLEDVVPIYVCNTGDHLPVYDLINEYFDNIQKSIDEANDDLLKQNPDPLLHPHFARRTVGFRPMSFDYTSQVYSDERLFTLLYKDRVVAAVTEVRNELNFVQFSFFSLLEHILSATN